MTAVDGGSEEWQKLRNKGITIISELFENKMSEINPKAWFLIRSTFITIERDHQLSEGKWTEIDNIMKVLLMEAHDLNTGPRLSEGRIYQEW